MTMVTLDYSLSPCLLTLVLEVLRAPASSVQVNSSYLLSGPEAQIRCFRRFCVGLPVVVAVMASNPYSVLCFRTQPGRIFPLGNPVASCQLVSSVL